MGDVNVAAHIAKDLPGQIQLPLQRLVVVHRVVVSDDPAFHPRLARQHAGVGDGGGAPADLLGVFVAGVLGFADEQVSAGNEVDGFAEGADVKVVLVDV